jgi:hypothetical protein
MLAERHYPIATGDSGIKLLTSYHLKETSGTAAAVVNVRNGGGAGAVIIPIRLEANEFVDVEFTAPLLSSDKWYIEVASGSVTGSFSGVT